VDNILGLLREDPPLLWGTVVTDVLVITAYFAVAAAFVTIAYRRGNNKYNLFLWKAAVFVALFGLFQITHLWNIWHTNFLLEIFIKLLVAGVSTYFAFSLWLALPRILKAPSHAQLEELNKTLAESETRYRKLFETANEGVIVTDLEGNFYLVNQAMADMLGTNKDQLLSKTFTDYIEEKSQQSLKDATSTAINGGKGRCEICLKHTNGTTVYSQIACTYILDQFNNECLLFVATDISEKIGLMKNLEILNQDLEAMVDDRTKELRTANARLTEEIDERQIALTKEKNSKARLDAVFNLSPNGMVITNKQGIITDVNTAAEAMFGYRRSELIAKHVNILTPEEFGQDHIKYIRDADFSLTSKKLGFGRKLTAVRRYGVSFPVDVSLTKIAHSDDTYYMAAIRDLTELDTVENELRSVNDRLMDTIRSLKQQSRETSLLNEYTELLQTCNSYDEYPSIVNSYCASIFGANSSQIYIVKEKDKLELLDSDHGPIISLQDCWALKANKPYPLNNRQQKIRCKHLSHDALTICLPLSAKGSLLGLISLEFSQEQVDFERTFESESTLHAFAVRTSICLANLKLLKEKELQSFKDELTGLYNRRFMNETLNQEIPRAKRENKAVTVLMIDVDHFKQFNDNYGHDLGDAVLIQVGHCIEQCMRETDLVCRFGGEEFLVIMFNASEEDGRVKANNIHAAMQTINNMPLPITVSIGVAQRGAQDTTETLIRHADLALYDAKENGRNQTQCYTLHQFKESKDDSTECLPKPN